MGDEEVEPWVAETQSLLGSIIKRPKLTQALLKKPPFRFLHDIVSEVTKVTGFPEGLYDEIESNSSNIKDKDSKIAYLQKIVDCVSFALATKIDIRPNKVVAGLEPETTNVLLQLLARAATDPNVDRSAAVQRVLAGDSTAPKPPPKPKPTTPEAAAEAPRPPPPQPAVDVDSAARRPSSLPPQPALPPAPMPPPPDPSTAPLNTFQTDNTPGEGDAGGAQKAERPRTARRQPPKVTNNVVKVDHAPPKGSETETAKNIITEGAAAPDDDDDDDIVIVDDAGARVDAPALKDSQGEGHTKIVKDILEAQKEMQDQTGDDRLAADTTEPKQTGIILGKKRGQGAGGADRQRSKDEIHKLRQDIQALCQSTNPLGKSLEYVHEDLEAMSRELDHWRSLHARHKSKMQEASLETDTATRELELGLEDVDRKLVEEKEKVRALKSAIIRNDATITKLLQGVVQ